jgi:flagellar motor protein MotB
MKIQILGQNHFRPLKAKRKEGLSWALSYGDMVTALLCFFIIFYAIEKQFEKKVNNPLKGYSTSEGILSEHINGGIDTDFEYAVESLAEIPGIHVQKTSQFVDIFFNKTVFFNKGETELTFDGKEVLDHVITRFAKLEGKYLLEIQGHADSTPVKSQKNRWWKNNMELSVMRALKVHSHLAENYIEKNHLIVSGYGSLKKISEKVSGQESDEDINRRISLRLQLVK